MKIEIISKQRFVFVDRRFSFGMCKYFYTYLLYTNHICDIINYNDSCLCRCIGKTSALNEIECERGRGVWLCVCVFLGTMIEIDIKNEFDKECKDTAEQYEEKEADF